MQRKSKSLAKLRRGGEQKVVVEHVHVYPGGKAFVGAVTQEGGEGDVWKNGQQPHGPEDTAALTYAPGTSMPSPKSGGKSVPVSSSEGKAEMQTPRRRERKRRASG